MMETPHKRPTSECSAETEEKRDMASGEDRFEVIDSDGHVVEPDIVWKEYTEPEYREALDVPGGGAQWLGMMRAYPAAIEKGKERLRERENWASHVGGETWDAKSRVKMGRPGGYDPHARLVDMDAEGIDRAVLYPTSMLTWAEDPAIFGAACRAYNNWLRDYCAAAPDRLYGVAVVPLQDVDAAIVEMRRCVERLGFKAVMLRPAAYRENKRLNHPDYDPFWRAAADLDCPIGIHPSPHPDMDGTCRRFGFGEGTMDPSKGLALQQGIVNAFDLQFSVGLFVLAGVCERHPELRVAFLEGSGGWIVPMLERFDHHFKVFGSLDQKTLPSELFARQCAISFDPDEITLAFTAEHLGAERVLWASDYPHPDAKIPGVVTELEDAVESLPASSRAEVMGGSARRFYNL
jgi:predicted TIM-barrel fold metal-dependent hydrolase